MRLPPFPVVPQVLVLLPGAHGPKELLPLREEGDGAAEVESPQGNLCQGFREQNGVSTAVT